MKKNWLNENSHKAMLVSTGMERLVPDVGYVVDIDDVEIPKEVFPEEYAQIRKILSGVLNKMKEHYENNNQQRKVHLPI